MFSVKVNERNEVWINITLSICNFRKHGPLKGVGSDVLCSYVVFTGNQKKICSALAILLLFEMTT